MTHIFLADEFRAGRADLANGPEDLVHVGEGAIENDHRRYLFLHPPAVLNFKIPGCAVRITSAVAMHPDTWDQPESGATEFFLIADGQLVFHYTIDPVNQPGDRKWHDFSITLPNSGNPERDLTLATRGVLSEAYRWALWADPVVQPLASMHELEQPALQTYETLWDEYSRLWDSEPYFRQFQYLGDEWGDDEWVTRHLESYAFPHLTPECHVLEIGPGGGRYTAQLAPRCGRLTCVDVSDLMLKRTRERLSQFEHIEYIQGNGYDLAGIPDASIDFVWSFNVFIQLEYEDLVHYLEEIRRVLKEGGKAALHYAVISSEDGWNYFHKNYTSWRWPNRPRGRFCELTLESMEVLLKRTGLLAVSNLHDARDAMVVFEKPLRAAEEALAAAARQIDKPHVSYPILLPPSTRMFTIMGSMKSGTTWLMNTLNLHPEIGCQGEMHPLELISTYPPLPMPTLETIALQMDTLKRWYFMPNSAWNVPYRERDKKDQISREMEKDFVRFFYEWTILQFYKAHDMPVPRWVGDKSPNHTHVVLRKIKYYFGVYRPLVIHLVRDPRDVAVSHWFHVRKLQHEGKFEFVPQFLDDEDRAACERFTQDPDAYLANGEPFFYYNPRYLRDVFMEWVLVNSSMFATGPYLPEVLLVKYEDLKQDFQGTLRRIFGKMGVSSSQQVLDEIQTASDVSKMQRKPGVFRKGSVGEWSKYFSPEDTALFEEMVLPHSRAYGYV